MPEPGEALYHALVKGTWPGLSEDSEEFRRQKTLVGRQLSDIRTAAQQVRIYADGALHARYWLPSFNLLAGRGCAAFAGLPWLVLLMMIPIFMAFMASFCEAYSFAERAVKHHTRKAAQGFQGILSLLKYALGLRDALPETAALEPLKIILEQFGVVDDNPYRRESSISCTHYSETFLDKGVRLRLVSMTYCLIVLSMCICTIPALAALRAGCNFGEQTTLRCINGAPQALSPDEGRVGDNLVNRDATAECNKVTDGLEHLVFRRGRPVAAFHVRKRVGTKNAPFVPSGVMPDGWEELDSNWFYVFGENKEAFEADFADKYERLSAIYLNGKTSGDGRSMLASYRARNGCNGPWMGVPFCMAIWNPSGSYDASGRFGGERLRDGWVLNIGRQLFGHPREHLVCRRANRIHLALYEEVDFMPEPEPHGHGGAADYASHDQSKRDERDQIQKLGEYGQAARVLFLRFLGPRLIVPIDGLDNERVRVAVAGRSVEDVQSLMAPICSAIVEGVADLKSALDERRRLGGTWRDVVREARHELSGAARPLVADLSRNEFLRGIALEQLDADVARALARARRPAPVLPRLPLARVAPVGAELTGGVPRGPPGSPPRLPPVFAAASPLQRDSPLRGMASALPPSPSPSPVKKKQRPGNSPGPL